MYPNVFLIESTEPGVFLIYSPLRMSILATNSAGASAFKRIQAGAPLPGDLALANLIEQSEAVPVNLPPDEFDTADLTIMPTFRCQLRCEYCFARGGERTSGLDIETAMKAVDFAIARDSAVKQTTSKLTWHGGGEPTLAWKLLKIVSAYHREKATAAGMRPILSIVSNGVWLPTVTEWIVEHMDKVTISCDGPADIQDTQRPIGGRSPSSPYVFQTLRNLKAGGVDFGIRSTITRLNVLRQVEMVEFFHELCGPKTLQFEPISICGRCGDTNQMPISADDFTTNFIAAHQRAESLGVSLGCAGVRLFRRSGRYCGAPGRTICVTPEGLLTTCHRVDDRRDPLASEFIFGHVSNTSTKYDRPHLDDLNQRLRVESLDWCKDCFCKYTCGGGCAASRFADSGSLTGSYSEDRCCMTREITRYRLTQIARKRGLIKTVTEGR